MKHHDSMISSQSGTKRSNIARGNVQIIKGSELGEEQKAKLKDKRQGLIARSRSNKRRALETEDNRVKAQARLPATAIHAY